MLIAISCPTLRRRRLDREPECVSERRQSAHVMSSGEAGQVRATADDAMKLFVAHAQGSCVMTDSIVTQKFLGQRARAVPLDERVDLIEKRLLVVAVQLTMPDLIR